MDSFSQIADVCFLVRMQLWRGLTWFLSRSRRIFVAGNASATLRTPPIASPPLLFLWARQDWQLITRLTSPGKIPLRLPSGHVRKKTKGIKRSNMLLTNISGDLLNVLKYNQSVVNKMKGLSLITCSLFPCRYNSSVVTTRRLYQIWRHVTEILINSPSCGSFNIFYPENIKQ